jgi:hypothetical protein
LTLPGVAPVGANVASPGVDPRNRQGLKLGVSGLDVLVRRVRELDRVIPALQLVVDKGE